jgi:hypothetical protein
MANHTQGAPVTDTKKFSESFDARDWAKAFVEIVKAHPAIATDEGTMIGWFANALMRGYDEAFWKIEREGAPSTDRIAPCRCGATQLPRLVGGQNPTTLAWHFYVQCDACRRCERGSHGRLEMAVAAWNACVAFGFAPDALTSALAAAKL